MMYLLPSLILALPIAGVTLRGSGADVGAQVDRHDEVAEVPSILLEFMNATSQPPSSSPSYYILEGIQNAFLPPALRLTGVINAFADPKPTSTDFWEIAKQSEEKLQQYVHSLLETAAGYFKSTKFTDIAATMNHVVNVTATFRDNIKDSLDAHQITFDGLTGELEGIFMAIANDLESIPLPDEAPSHAERAEMVDKVLDDTEQALIELATRYGIEEKVITTYLDALKPQIHSLIVVVGDINEQHPQILPALLFSVAVMLIPEWWILRPFLSVFGFGPAGPVKGSVAAWLQRRFWGAAVEAGSWFSWLQAAGMGVLPKWAGLVSKIPFLIGSILAMLLPCLNRG